MSHESGRRSDLLGNASAEKVKKIIADVCKIAGASVAIEERLGTDSDLPPSQNVQITYTGEKPMPYSHWFKLVNTIDEALDSSELIDWESSKLSEETEQERMATWRIATAE